MEKRGNTTRQALRYCLLLALLSPLTGCSLLSGVNNFVAYNANTDDMVLGWRNHVYSRRAYNLRSEVLPAGRFESHFRAGFIAGYNNVANGGNGCAPAMAPRKYWSWKYQTPEGQCKVDAWFQGFPHGARAAEEDGIGNYRAIQLSGQFEQMLKDHNYGGGSSGCINCGSDEELPPGLNPYPDPNMLEPGVQPMDTLPLGAVEHSSHGDFHRSPIRPVSYEIEPLPSTDSTE